MSSTSISISTGVAGLITTPARQSWLLIRCRVRSRWRQASWCTDIQSTPASANTGINSSGFSIIRWQSSGNFVTLRSDFTTGGPIVRFGTKCPSITSTWMTLAPPSVAAHTCSPSRAKSAERIDGASSIKRELSEPGQSGNYVLKFYHALRAVSLVVLTSRGTSCPLFHTLSSCPLHLVIPSGAKRRAKRIVSRSPGTLGLLFYARNEVHTRDGLRPAGLNPSLSWLVLPSSVPPLTPFAPAACSVAAVFIWGASDFAGGYASRRANAFTLTAFSHICAFALMFTLALLNGGEFPSTASILWAIAAGSSGGFSLALFYRALASGQMGLTAPIAALVGAAIPTMVDIALEGAPSRWTIGGFVLAVLAIWLITRPEPSNENNKEQPSGRPAGVGLAALAGVGFAGFYLCIHQATGSPAWIASLSRIGSFTATAVAVVVTRAPLKLDGPRATLGMLAGFLDITASALFIFASQHGRLDEAVLITSLYPAVTVLLARIVLKEHFSRWKVVGLLAALAAVPLLAAG